MGKVYVSSNQEEGFIKRYALFIAGFLFTLPPIFFGYYRIHTARRLIAENPFYNLYRGVGWLFIVFGSIILCVFLFVVIIKGEKK